LSDDPAPLAAEGAAEAARSLGERDLDTLYLQDARAFALVGLRRAAEAEKLLRRTLAILAEKVAKGEDAGEGNSLADDARVHLGMALAQLRRWPEAEALLVGSVPKMPQREARTKQAVRFVADFYLTWNRSEPDPVRSAAAADWQKRVEASATSVVAR